MQTRRSLGLPGGWFQRSRTDTVSPSLFLPLKQYSARYFWLWLGPAVAALLTAWYVDVTVSGTSHIVPSCQSATMGSVGDVPGTISLQ
eukprot:4837424-Pyramimonas_sp.AAC.1